MHEKQFKAENDQEEWGHERSAHWTQWIMEIGCERGIIKFEAWSQQHQVYQSNCNPCEVE